MQRAEEALDETLQQSRLRAQAKQELSQAELWMLENGRMLKTVAKDLARSFKESRKAHKRGADTRSDLHRRRAFVSGNRIVRFRQAFV